MHNLQKALSVADTVVVLTRGQVAGRFDSATADIAEITDLVARG